MKKIYNTFTFVGDLGFPNDMENFITRSINKNGTWENIKSNKLYVKDSNHGSSAFLNLDFGHSLNSESMIYTLHKNGTKLVVPFSKRLDGDVLDSVADFRKIVFNLIDDVNLKEQMNKIYFKIASLNKKLKDGTISQEELNKKAEYEQEYKKNATENIFEFISSYDAIEFLKENYAMFDGKKVKVKGNVELSSWQGKYYTSFIPTHFEIMPPHIENRLELNLDIYFTPNSLYEKGHEAEVLGYLCNYDKNLKKDLFFPKSFTIKNENNETYNFLMSLFSYSNKRFPENNQIFHINCLADYFRGAELLPITENDLTDAQKKMISLGMAKIEDFGDKKFGENVEKIYIKLPNLTGEFSAGARSTGIDVEEFKSLISKGETLQNVSSKNNNEIQDVPKSLLDELMGK